MPRFTVVYEGDPNEADILSGEPAAGRAITVGLGDLYAEAARSERHRNDLTDRAASLGAERDALQARVDTLEAQLRDTRRAAAGGNALSSTADLLRWASERIVPKPDDRAPPEPRHFVERAAMLDQVASRGA